MKRIPVRLIPEGTGGGLVPVNIALVDGRDVDAAGVPVEDAIRLIAREINGPVGVNIFDMEAVTTTSDGLVVEGAITMMAAGDMGKVHQEFGTLPMAEMEVTADLVDAEPHLKQVEKYYPGRRLLRGPDPKTKLVPVHNAVMTGRAVNNNSATEMMNVVTMQEILLPILGQLQIMRDEDVLFGLTGEHISVGIGMTVAEKFGRVFPFRQFRAGDTAHGSGDYARNLKDHIPCILSPKDVLARHIVRALRMGMVPGEHLGCSPAVLAVARAMGCRIALGNITERALEELASVGLGREFLSHKTTPVTGDEVVARAEEIIPGAPDTRRVHADELVTEMTVSV